MDGRHRRRAAAADALQCCEFCEHRSPRFHYAAESVSAKESDRSVAIVCPNDAVIAAVGIEFLRYCPFAGRKRLHTLRHAPYRSDGTPLRCLWKHVNLA